MILQVGRKTSLDFFSFRKDNPYNAGINSEEVLKEFGQRAQRCFGCFVAYRLRDMYLGEDATFYCNYCKDDAMFHFDEFTKIIDISKLREGAEAE